MYQGALSKRGRGGINYRLQLPSSTFPGYLTIHANAMLINFEKEEWRDSLAAAILGVNPSLS